MPKPSATSQMERNVDRLVRSLVGVVDYVAQWDGPGRIQRLDILRDMAVEEHQLVRNVVSGLGAGSGIRIPRSHIQLHTDAAAFRAATAVTAEIARGRAARVAELEVGAATPTQPASDVPGPATDAAVPADSAPAPGSPAAMPADPAPMRPKQQNGSANGSINGTARDNARTGPGRPAAGGRVTPAADASMAGRPAPADSGHVVPLPAPQATEDEDRPRRRRQPPAAPQRRARREEAPSVPGAAVLATRGSVSGAELRLEQLELENRGLTLRCRAVLVLGDNIYSAIAEVPAGPTAESDVAARVTLDALRAGALVGATLDGIGFCTIGGRSWVVAAVRDSGNVQARAGVVPLRGSMGRAAAEAVLAALGPVTKAHQDAAELRLGGL